GATEAGLRGSRSGGGQRGAEESACAALARTLQATRAIEGLARGRGESALGGGGGAQEGRWRNRFRKVQREPDRDHGANQRRGAAEVSRTRRHDQLRRRNPGRRRRDGYRTACGLERSA